MHEQGLSLIIELIVVLKSIEEKESASSIKKLEMGKMTRL